MNSFKTLYNILEAFAISFWGITVIDVLPFLNIDILSNVDNVIKTSMAIFGLLWFIINLPHKYKMNKLERKIKEEELEKLEKENDK